jgi:hypothetical protein
MRFEMQPYAQAGVLAGAFPGQKVFAELVASTRAPQEPEICFVDFSGVTVATTSFLRESVVAYRNHARSHWSTVYPVAANLAALVREDLESFLRDQGDAIVACDLSKAGRASNVQILGRLDGRQQLTLRAVVEQGEVDAPLLAKLFKNEGPASPTAWNNLLVALTTKGLVIEFRSGRGKSYRPVLEGLQYGT